jgi:flagellar biosynthesis protein FlhG
LVLNETIEKKIIPIAGGKGGVGKSILSVNIALSLAISDKKTILIDMDLGGANLHTILGMKNTNPGIGTYLQEKKMTFQSLVIETPYKNLYFIPGDTLSYGMADITSVQKKELLREIQELDADYIIIDLGAGSSFNTIDFFLISNSGLIVTTPHASSIMNAYSFTKNLTIRFLHKAFSKNKKMDSYLRKNIKRMLPGTNLTLAHLLREVGQDDPGTMEKAKAYLEVLQPKMILNMVEEEEDFQMAENLGQLVAKDLLVNMDCLGIILFDRDINESLHNRSPFLMEYQDALSAQQIFRIGQKIVQSRHFPDLPLDLNEYSSSYELAQIETENDFQIYQQIKEQQESSSKPEYDIDQLMEIIEKQQQKIQELQNTVRMMSLGNQGGGGGGLGGLFNIG